LHIVFTIRLPLYPAAPATGTLEGQAVAHFLTFSQNKSGRRPMLALLGLLLLLAEPSLFTLFTFDEE
jgi:hypothetical protein